MVSWKHLEGITNNDKGLNLVQFDVRIMREFVQDGSKLFVFVFFRCLFSNFSKCHFLELSVVRLQG